MMTASVGRKVSFICPDVPCEPPGAAWHRRQGDPTRLQRYARLPPVATAPRPANQMIIRLRDCPSQAWKNGLGRTREIAVQPPTAGSDDFLWRVSIAEVDSAAPFSCFPGIDRQIVLLDGDGFTMLLDGNRSHALTTPFVPFAFAGETRVDVALVGGATRDFNLMVRRNHLRGNVQAWSDPGVRIPDPTTMLVFCARGEIDTVDGRLDVGDAWCPSLPGDNPLTLRDDAIALAIHIKPHTF